MPSDYRHACAVNADGISHVFTPFSVGATCACGRTTAALSDDEHDVVFRRSAPRPRLTPRPPLALPPRPAWAVESDGLLTLGGAAIAASRALHARVAAERVGVREGRRLRATARAGRAAPGWHAS